MPEYKNKLKKAKLFAASPLIRQRSGQIAETTTWMVATTIIIVILFTSIYAATLISKTTKIVGLSDSISFLKEQRANIFLKESLFAFALTKSNEGTNIYKQIESAKSLPTSAASLGIEVFKRAHDSSNVSSMFLKYNEVNHNIFSYGNFKQKFQVVEKIQIDRYSTLEVAYYSEQLNKKINEIIQ